MVWRVLPTVVVEALANHLLRLDDGSVARMQQLADTRVRVTLHELGQPLTMTVTAQEMLLSWVDTDPVDCHVITRMAVLPELRDTANISRLIKASALDMGGDPLIAQRVSRLFTELDIDWEEHLSQQLGDVPAYFLSQAFQRSRAWLQQALHDQQAWMRDVLIEEKQVLVSRTEFELFQQQVQQLRAQFERLERDAKTILPPGRKGNLS